MGIKTIPFAYFLGNPSDFSGILLQTIWLIILIIIGNFILNRVIKRLEVFGG